MNSLFFITLFCFIAFSYASIFVCDSPNSKVNGEFKRDKSRTTEEMTVFTNENDISIFNNNKLWYIGDLNPWPPITYYRCQDPLACYDKPFPSTEASSWKPNVKAIKEGDINISLDVKCVNTIVSDEPEVTNQQVEASIEEATDADQTIKRNRKSKKFEL